MEVFTLSFLSMSSTPRRYKRILTQGGEYFDFMFVKKCSYNYWLFPTDVIILEISRGLIQHVIRYGIIIILHQNSSVNCAIFKSN